MDELYTSAVNFGKLIKNEYRFKVKKNTELIEIVLHFKEEDFHHLVGMQYLTDIRIPKNKEIAFSKILDKDITYDYVSSSKLFENIKDCYADVKSRIHCFQAIEEYLDTKNLIFKYIKDKNKYSKIKADFMIESCINHDTVYIFIKKRNEKDENSKYVLCSFFKKGKVTYCGDRVFWKYKEKYDVETKTSIILLDNLSKEVETMKDS